MSHARALVIFIIFFLMGVASYSVLEFSWWLVGFLIILVSFSGIITASQLNNRAAFIFLAALAMLVGFFRIATYHQPLNLLDQREKSFWQEARANLTQKSSQILPKEEASLFNAMVFGDEKDISLPLKEAFNRTGTRHILAISGMNISIVALMLMNFGFLLGLWRKHAFWLAALGVTAFIFLVGSPASAVRAGIMAIIMLWAKNRGRLVLAWRPIMLAAFFMVALNPRLLIFDIGFQLSFLAVIGLIYFKNFWDRIFKWLPIKWLRELIVLSMAAQITTWPIIIYNFGNFSVIGPMANIFIVPMLNPVMFLGLGFAAVSWNLFLAKLFLWPAWLILHLVDKAVFWFSSIPWANLNFNKGGLFLLLIYYPALIWFWKFLEKRGLNDPISS